MKKWIIGWGVAGLVAPLLYLFIYLVTGYMLGEGIFAFWPGAMGLMALNGQPLLSTVVYVCFCIATNVILYGVLGILFWGLSRFKSEGPSEGKEKK